MRNTLLGSLTGLLMPLASYGMASTSYSSYQRNYSQVVKYETVALDNKQKLKQVNAPGVEAGELTLQSGAQATELIIVDAAVPDKHELRKLLRPGVALIELNANQDAVQQIVSALEQHQDLKAIHLVSHAAKGALQVGDYQLDRNSLSKQTALWNALNKSTRSGADLLLYGCELAAEGTDVLDIIQQHTHLDVAASNNLTGAKSLNGDWDLEIHAGNIEAQTFSAKALQDFNAVLATTIDFQTGASIPDNYVGFTRSGYTFSLVHEVHGSYPDAGLFNTLNGACKLGGAGGTQYSLFAGYLNFYGNPPDKVYITKSGGGNFALKNLNLKGITTTDVNSGSHTTTSVTITAYSGGSPIAGGTVTQNSVNSAFTAIDLSANSKFASVDKIRITPNGGSFCLKTIGFDVPNVAPTDISLTSSSVNQSGGVNAVVGTLSSTDADVGNTHTYTLVAGAGDTNNASFNISGSSLRASNAAALAAGNYSVRIRTTDNIGATYEEAFTITVVDNVPPAVSSIALSGSPAATATSVDFVVTFNSSANNISMDDFQLTTTSGTASGTIASVSASSGSSVNVTVNGISGNGVLRLDLKASTNITDAAGNGNNTNGYVAAFTSGSTHTVAIPTAPAAPTIGTATPGDGQVSVTFTAPGNNGGSAITGYTVTSNPGGITAGGNSFTTSPITVTGLTNGTPYTFTVTATNSIGTSTASGASGSATPKGNQTITFTQPASQNFGSSPTLSASTTSSLTVTFSSSTTGVCTITSGGVLAFITAGSCTINADQAGNGTWNAATQVNRTFTVNAIVPDAPTIGTATAGNGQADVTFTAPASNGGATITGYTVTANPGGATATGAGSPITVTSLSNGVPYTFTVTATNSAGTGGASGVSNSITPKAPQTITFANPGTQNYGTAPDLSILGGGASSTSGLTVTFTSSTTGVCTISSSGVLAFVTAGSCTINADQAGTSAFLPATQVSQTFTVSPVAPDAPTSAVATAGDTQVSIAFVAPTNAGGSPITGYTVTPNPLDVAPVSGASSPIVVSGLTNGQAYTFTVTADNVAGTGSASIPSNSATPKAGQIVTFINPGPQSFGTTPTFNANSDSGLQPTFTSSTTGVCTITSGGAVTFITVGTCTINADQPGNGSYLAATQVTHSFAVNAVVPGAPTIGTATAGDAQASVTFTAPAFVGGATITSYTVTASPGGASATGSGSPVTVTGLVNGTAYTFTVTATNSVGTGSASAVSNSVAPNGPPVIGGTPATSVAEDTAYAFTPTANDSVGDVLTFGITNKPSWASFNTATGALTGTPTNADVGTTTGIVISVSDGSLSDSLTAFDLAVTNVNDAPLISGTPATSIAQDVAYSFTPTASDVDVGDVLTFSIANKPSWASFNTVTGALTGTPTNADVGTTTGIVISVSDGTVSVDLATFNLAVTNINDAPLISGTPATTVAQDVAYSFTPTASDIDVGDVLTFSIANKPTWASFDTATGALTGTPTNADVGTTMGIVISVSDGTTTTNLAAFSLQVTNVNDAPVISGTPATLVAQDAAYSFMPTVTDEDIGDVMTFSIANKPTWASFDTATGALTGTPTNAHVGTTTGIVISVNDGTTTSSLAAFSIEVTNVNEVPVISGTPATTVAQDVAYSFTPTASDVDVGDLLTFSIANKPTWASFNATTGALTGTPTNADIGTTTGIVITVSDGTLSASLAAFNLVVTNVNEVPVISGTPATSVAQDAAYSFTPTASDVDVGDVLTYSIANKPTWASFNAATGALTGTPTNADVGTTTGIVISVSDGTLSASLAAFNLVVTNVNDAPVISGTPATSIAQGLTYSFTPTASDEDVGDVLAFSITNKPAWATFNPATGLLYGNPVNADVGTTTGIVISVSDGTTSTSLAAFNLEVIDVNDTPMISGTPATTVAQGAAYSFVPTATDEDAGDVLTYIITNKPSWASFDPATGALTGTPGSADVGITTGILIFVTDGSAGTFLSAFNLEVTNVNDAPVIGGMPITSVNQDVAYSFIPTASDVDVGDVLTFSITNKPTWASFNTATGALTGTPAGADSGVTTGIVISVSDGTVSASLPAFNLEVVSTVDPLQPIVTAPAAIDVNATALFTPISLRQLLGLAANATQAQVDQALKSLAADGVNGNNCCTVMAEGLQQGNTLLVRPGHHLLKWKATNAAGITGEASQVVNVKPLVSLSKSQVAVRGSNVEFRVLLNGPSPVYPLSIPYVVDASSTATTQEHNLVSGTATFTQPGQVEVVIPVSLNAVTGFSDSQLVVVLGDGINAGASKRHVIDIRQGNVPPIVTLSITQGGFSTSLITPAGGPVTVTATVTDLNQGDTHSFDWSATTGLADTDGNPTNGVRVFSPAGLNGSNQVKVTVTDSGGASVQASAYFRVVGVLPVLSPNIDTDQDGIDDDLEGTGDGDDNGIPDYLDNMPSTNILPQQGNTTNSYLIECDPGVRCGLGLFARTSTSGGVQILNDELGTIPNIEIDKVFEPVGGVFDFAIRDLPTPGQAVRVVVPQRAAIPANATYRKFQRGRWVSFVIDADNAIHSAPGNPGYCPPPGTDDWTPGLTVGHLCVQLTIKDGGPNDDDGLVNSAVVDPGAVSVAMDIPEPPEPPKPPVEIKTTGGGGSIQALWVLLLGGLLMVKRVSTKGKIITAVVGVVTILASIATQAATGPYLRVDVSNVSSSQREEDFTAALAASNYDLIVDRYDTNRTGYQLALGYQWDQHASTEIGYLDLGEVKVDLTVAGETDFSTLPWNVAREYPLSAEGFTLVQGLTLNPADGFRVIGEIGVFIWRSEVDVENDVISIKRDRGEDPIVGVRFELPIQEKFGLGLGMRRIYFDTQEADLVSLTGTFRF